MTLNKAIKFNAKKCLRNNWGRAILIFVIMVAVSAVLGALDNAIFSAFGFHRVEISIDLLRGGYMEWWLAEGADVTWYEVALSILLSLVQLCIMAPLTLGAANWALELSDGRSNSIGELFWAFDNAAWYRSVWMSITVAVKTGLFAIAVEAIPTVMMAIGAANLWENRQCADAGGAALYLVVWRAVHGGQPAAVRPVLLHRKRGDKAFGSADPRPPLADRRILPFLPAVVPAVLPGAPASVCHPLCGGGRHHDGPVSF